MDIRSRYAYVCVCVCVCVCARLHLSAWRERRKIRRNASVRDRTSSKLHFASTAADTSPGLMANP